MKERIDEAEFVPSASLGAPDAVATSEWVVLKFGGTSVATAERWQTIAAVVRNRLASGLRTMIVHSAIAGTSDALERILALAVADDAGAGAEIRALEDRHLALARSLGLDGPALLAPYFEQLEQTAAGIRLVGEASPRVTARTLALGEQMSTTLGAAWLNSVDVETHWIDAREMLTSDDAPQRGSARNYLSATCDDSADPALAERLGHIGKVILTQGFIARNARDETVLLGRGGSDTSAAYLAAKLQARRLEIWTDVPGMFSADPKLVPSSRLLAELHYDEAKELASTGSRVLHPRCLGPVESNGIPLFIRSTTAPEIAGTIISSVTREHEPQVKGVSGRRNVTLISMDGLAMWHEAGFLAEAFAAFSRHGVSVDLISTSQSSVTVSIDTDDQMLPPDVQDALIADLQPLCHVQVITDCAVVSLVGRRIRTILPRLAAAFKVFDEEKIYLVSQAANDLNFSIVIDEEQLPRLAKRVHAAIVPGADGSGAFGPSWESLFGEVKPAVVSRDAWWIRKRERLIGLLDDRANAYVYDAETVRRAAASLLGLESVDRVLYAMKANFNPQILRIIAEAGVDFECVSPGEVQHLRAAVPGIDSARILFTPNFAPREEYAWALAEGLQLTLDNLYPLKAWPDLFAGSRLFIRIDPGEGRGHHEHVKTGGKQSKFGVPLFEVDELDALIKAAGAEVVGIHAHSGSGILDPDNWGSVAAILARVADRFPQAEVLDLGGGLGVPDRAGDSGFDLAALDEMLKDIRRACPRYRLWLEPGRYLVAQSGVLLTRVTQTKGKGEMRYVGVNTGMNSLIRPALYGAWHEIVNLTRAAEAATESVTVVGPICETGDKLGTERMLPPCSENDVIAIANAGAYGRVMSSRYNLREPADEVVI